MTVGLEWLLIVCLKDAGWTVNRHAVAVGVCYGGAFKIPGTCKTLMSLENNEEKVGEEESVAHVLDKLSLSEDKAVMVEVVDSEKVKTRTRTLGALTVKEADLKEGKVRPDTYTDAEVVELRRITVPPTWKRYCKSTSSNAKLHATFSVDSCKRCKLLFVSYRNPVILKNNWGAWTVWTAPFGLLQSRCVHKRCAMSHGIWFYI